VWFILGALIVGVPISLLVAHWFVGTAVVVACGLLAVWYRETFFDRVANSDWWHGLGGRR
jgi:hypothetical protein